MLLITKLVNTNITMVSQILHLKKRYENDKTFLRHRSYLTTSDVCKYYWKLVGNGAVPTIKFSIVKHVKGNTFINNCNLRLREKTVIKRNSDDVNMLSKRSEFSSKCRHMRMIVKDDSND